MSDMILKYTFGSAKTNKLKGLTHQTLLGVSKKFEISSLSESLRNNLLSLKHTVHQKSLTDLRNI